MITSTSVLTSLSHSFLSVLFTLNSHQPQKSPYFLGLILTHNHHTITRFPRSGTWNTLAYLGVELLLTLICGVLLVLVTQKRSPRADRVPLSGNMKYKSIKLGSGNTEETLAALVLMRTAGNCFEGTALDPHASCFLSLTVSSPCHYITLSSTAQ